MSGITHNLPGGDNKKSPANAGAPSYASDP